MSNQRVNFDDQYMEIVDIIAKRSPCLSRHVGAVLTIDNRIIATGYNGPPSKMEHCQICVRKSKKLASGLGHEFCPAVHAEQNVIISCVNNGIKVKNATIYISCMPCSMCMRLLLSLNINCIIYRTSYPDKFSAHLLFDSGFQRELQNKYFKWIKP
jgi:dCMP deaminase